MCQNPIHITRHKDGRCTPVEISPEDRSWVLYIDKEGRPSLWLDFPGSVPVDESDPSKGFFGHAYMPAQVAYQVAPERMTEVERAAIEAAAEPPRGEP